MANSMTGFGRAESENGGGKFLVEINTVNNRFLEFQIRLPKSLGQLENEIKSGSWLPTDVTASVVFDTPSDELWARAYQRVGASPMSFTARTVGLA